MDGVIQYIMNIQDLNREFLGRTQSERLFYKK